MTAVPKTISPDHAKALSAIRQADERLTSCFADRMAC